MRDGRNKAAADGRRENDDFFAAGAIAEKHAGVSLMK